MHGCGNGIAGKLSLLGCYVDLIREITLAVVQLVSLVGELQLDPAELAVIDLVCRGVGERVVVAALLVGGSDGFANIVRIKEGLSPGGHGELGESVLFRRLIGEVCRQWNVGRWRVWVGKCGVGSLKRS